MGQQEATCASVCTQRKSGEQDVRDADDAVLYCEDGPGSGQVSTDSVGAWAKAHGHRRGSIVTFRPKTESTYSTGDQQLLNASDGAEEGDADADAEEEDPLPFAKTRSWRDEQTGFVVQVDEEEAAVQAAEQAKAAADEAAAETAAVDATSSMTSIKAFRVIPNVQTALKNWRRQMVTGFAPTETELRRGVHVERVFDFYDIVDGKVRVRKMFGDVLHTRRSGGMRKASCDSADGMPSELLSSEVGSVMSDDMMSSEGSSSSTASKSTPRTVKGQKSLSPCTTPRAGGKQGSPNADGRSLRNPLSGLRRASTTTDQERVTQWGVVVGRLLHTRLLDFTEYGDVTVVKRRMCGTAPAYTVMSGLVDRAKLVVKQAEALSKRVLKENQDRLDSEWEQRREALLVHLFSKEYVDSFVLLAKAARNIMAEQPVMVEVSAPAKVFGDIHGQLRDMLLLFAVFGFPSAAKEAPVYVFNGDFVDRGTHSLAVIGILFALKVAMPDKIFLVRGNHEEKSMNEKYGFKDECLELLGQVFGQAVYDNLQKAFDYLPLACLIANRILVVHGGVGNGQWRLGDLRSVKRPVTSNMLEDPAHHWIYNLLWSDPIEEDDERMEGVFGVHPSSRGLTASQFAWDVTTTFCARSGLGLIVRSHQSKQNSLGFSIMHDNLLIRVFSARDYEFHGNDGAILLIQTTSWEGKPGLLTVRPQVLRSLTKATDEDIVRSLVTNGGDPVKGARRTNTRETLALVRTERRRNTIFRDKQADAKDTIQAQTQRPRARLWRLKEGGDRTNAVDWSLSDSWISPEGHLMYFNIKKEKDVIAISAAGLDGATLHQVSNGATAKMWAFRVRPAAQSQPERDAASAPQSARGRVYDFAAETQEMRERWLEELQFAGATMLG